MLEKTSAFAIYGLPRDERSGALQSLTPAARCVATPRADAVTAAAADDGEEEDMFLEVLLESMGQKPARYTAKAFCGRVIDLPPPVGGILIEQDAGLNKSGVGGTGGIVWDSGVWDYVQMETETDREGNSFFDPNFTAFQKFNGPFT